MNLDAEIRDDALAPYPHLLAFYRDFISRTEAKLMVSDDLGRHWLRVGFNRGRITVTFLLRHGMLTPMDDKLRPDGVRPAKSNSLPRDTFTPSLPSPRSASV